MSSFTDQIRNELSVVLQDLQAVFPLDESRLFVIGTSTSEIIGKHIGSAGSEEVAEALFSEFHSFKQKTNVHLAFQCCEHLNRALVVERETVQAYRLDEVTVKPCPQAGGAMASYAYEHLKQPVMVEHVQADAAIDIGDTLIGMHVKPVAVPVRSQITSIGHAHVTLAKTRPKLIGGERAVYPK